MRCPLSHCATPQAMGANLSIPLLMPTKIDFSLSLSPLRKTWSHSINKQLSVSSLLDWKACSLRSFASQHHAYAETCSLPFSEQFISIAIIWNSKISSFCLKATANDSLNLNLRDYQIYCKRNPISATYYFQHIFACFVFISLNHFQNPSLCIMVPAELWIRSLKFVFINGNK